MALILVLVTLSGGGGDDKPSNTDESAGLAADVEPTPEATIDLARPTVVANNNPTSVSPDDRLVITKFGVSAPLTLKTVGLDGVMPNPDGPDDSAFYDFSAWPGKGGSPGKGGNAIFSGHVDSGQKACKNGSVPPPCQAVFWDLNNLRLGDEIEIHLSGVVHKYRVTSNQPINAANGPWDQIVSSTAEESLTLITCGGDFNRETREYNNRQVVTAVRI
jgi:LPXTG-site transpeptidase (sortase) family protein